MNLNIRSDNLNNFFNTSLNNDNLNYENDPIHLATKNSEDCSNDIDLNEWNFINELTNSSRKQPFFIIDSMNKNNVIVNLLENKNAKSQIPSYDLLQLNESANYINCKIKTQIFDSSIDNVIQIKASSSNINNSILTPSPSYCSLSSSPVSAQSNQQILNSVQSFDHSLFDFNQDTLFNNTSANPVSNPQQKKKKRKKSKSSVNLKQRNRLKQKN